ncbi:MAG: hypothetical protein D4R65_00460 [Verrucomicrobiaceae bacterium]|nr:MAG: hypothetical protein D4R65_00460 [Verrucomicrobiaceae bacterium]
MTSEPKKPLMKKLAILAIVPVLLHTGWSAESAKPVTPKFQFLPAGEVKPRGWLLEQLRNDVKNGFTPVLDKLTPDYCNLSTFDTRKKADMEQPKIGGVWWVGETTGNWLDSFIRMAYLADDPQAKARVDELVSKVLAMQEDDGYLGAYPRGLRYQSPLGQPNNGELWDQACLFRGLLAYYELTGRKDVLAAVQRAVDLTLSKYGKDRPYWPEAIPRGGPPHSLMFVDVCEYLYRITGEKRYVDFAQFLYDGYNVPEKVFDADILLRNLADPDKLFAGHCAHITEHLRVPLFVYYATGDDKYRVAVENEFMKTARHTGASGACIGDEDIRQRLSSPYLTHEQCTMFELLNSLQSGVEKTGRADLGDWIEWLAYSAAQGARMRDGNQATCGIQYEGYDNQFQATHKERGGRCKYSPTHEDVAVCCPPTAGKMYAYLTNYLWMKEARGNGLAAVTYAPNSLQTKVDGVPVTIDTDTSYPFEDEVRMTLKADKPVEFPIWLRIPAWPGSVRVDAPGAEIREEKGWKIVTKKWNTGDKITLSFAPEIVQKKAPNGEIFWRRGPLVFALPIPSEQTPTKKYAVEGFADWDITPKEGAIWDYAVDKDSGDFQLERSPKASSGLPWCASPVALKGRLLNRKTNKLEEVRLVPIGTSLLRRTAFTDMKSVGLIKKSDNLAAKAKIEVTSTSKGFSDAALIDGVAEGYPQNQKAEWASDHATTGTKVKLTWDKPITIEDVWFFDRPNEADQVLSAWVNFSDGSSEMVDQLPNDGITPFKMNFPEKTITWMEVIITRVSPTTRSAGFSEIAVFKKAPGE